ncbi:hypothetical protein [Quatrionicoccus australiensis]|uniref:hypothetical protein n=1 Tax=Quatrionicoccus australiensis TaxID=138118 RepID=UPI001CF8B96A|nr:hypothetical protein [Quatrionicoccus australiensis]UCV16644.1 hypothetical protein KI612_08225 [Quatrionicoccus australiensis]
MSYGYSLLRRFAPLLSLIALFSLNACAGLFGLGGDSWQEEVLLHDGNKLVVDRSVERGGPHEIGQKPAYTKQTLAFTHPATGERVVWEDKATPDLGNSNFLPMALDIYQGKIYLVANPMGCLAYNKWGRPNPPYVIFRYDGKTWVRIPLHELPPETKTPNLIVSSPDTQVESLRKRFVDSEAIKRLNAGFRQPEYKAILREALSKERLEQMCEERVLYNGYWIIPNDPIARSMIDQREKQDKQ